MTSKSKPKPQAKISPPEPKPAPAIIVFGADQANKPRAASFTGGEVEAATKAAELMKLRVLKVEGPELTELAARLEVGRIYASGHGFVPPIRPNLYERLSELADPKPAPSLPRSWDDIEIGHFVLATEGPGEGYWKPSSWAGTMTCSRSNGLTTRTTRSWSATAPQWRCSNPAQSNRQPQLEA